MTRASAQDRLRHILDAIEKVERFTRGGRQEFFGSDLIQQAVVYEIFIIGEAARAVPDDLRDRCPDVPWRQIIGTRNVIAHGYDQINLDRIWAIVELHLPELKKQIEDLLSQT